MPLTKEEQLRKAFKSIAKDIYYSGCFSYGSEPKDKDNYIDKKVNELLKEVTIRVNLK